MTAKRFIAADPISRNAFDRLLKVAHAQGVTTGMLVYAALRDMCPDLPPVPSALRYKVDPAPIVGGYVLRIYPPKEVFEVFDAWYYAMPTALNVREQLKMRLLKEYCSAPSDDPELPLNFNP